MTTPQLIRFAMLIGVLLFGGTVYFLRQRGDMPTIGPEQTATLALGAKILWGLAIALCVVLFARRLSSPTRVTTISIVAWAVGEGLALFGAVFWMQTGSSEWYYPGLIFLVLTFVAFPVQPSRV
jgi:multisubunit Na+/H+ antiporter MnhF subunit